MAEQSEGGVMDWIHCKCGGKAIGYNRNWVLNFWAITRLGKETTFACPRCREEWSIDSEKFEREWTELPPVVMAQP